MTDLIIDNGVYEEILHDFEYNEAKLSWRKNADESFSLTVYKTYWNQFAFDLLENEVALIVDGQYYMVKHCEPRHSDGLIYKEVMATHISFDFQFHIAEGFVTKTARINELCDFVFKNNKFGYTYSILGDFGTQGIAVENFGDGSDAIALVQSIASKYGAVIEVNNKHFTFIKESNWGRTTEKVFRYLYNTDDVNVSIDSTEMRTKVKLTGKMKDEEEGGGYYFEPFSIVSKNEKLVEKFGTDREQEPIDDERFTDRLTMEAYGYEKLHDRYDISLSLKNHDDTDVEKGEQRVFIYEPLDIYEEVKVVGYDKYPFATSHKSPEVILSNDRKDMISIQNQLMGTTKSFDKMFIQNPYKTINQYLPEWTRTIVNQTIPRIDLKVDEEIEQGQRDKEELEQKLSDVEKDFQENMESAFYMDYIKSKILVSDSILANMIKADEALFDKIFVNDGVFKKLVANDAFIENLQVQELTGLKITAPDIQIPFDYNAGPGHLVGAKGVVTLKDERIIIEGQYKPNSNKFRASFDPDGLQTSLYSSTGVLQKATQIGANGITINDVTNNVAGSLFAESLVDNPWWYFGLNAGFGWYQSNLGNTYRPKTKKLYIQNKQAVRSAGILTSTTTRPSGAAYGIGTWNITGLNLTRDISIPATTNTGQGAIVYLQTSGGVTVRGGSDWTEIRWDAFVGVED